MTKIVAIAFIFFSSFIARAGCDDLLNGNGTAILPPSFRLLLNNGVEIELQLDRYPGQKLHWSKVIIGRHGVAAELKKEAELRYYTRHVFDLQRLEISDDQKTLTLSDRRRFFTMTLYLNEPLGSPHQKVRSFSVKTNHRWVNKNVPTAVREGEFVVLSPLPENQIDFAFRGGASDQIAQALEHTMNDDELVEGMLDEVKPLLETIKKAPYSREMNLAIKYYRGLVLVRLDIKGHMVETYAFSTVKSAVQMFDLLTGLKALGLPIRHPIFKLSERLAQTQIH